MSVTLSELFSDTKRIYKLQLLAGKGGMNSNVSWVYLMEDTAMADYFWGNELAITTGVGVDGDSWLLSFVKILVAQNASGIIVNTGKYINRIPDSVIKYCEAHNFPIFTMPWEIFLTEVIKDYCMRIFTDNRNDEAISRALINAIRSPKNEEAYMGTLQNYFNVNSSFLAIVIYLEFPPDASQTARPKAEVRIRSLLSRISEKFNLFRLEEFFVVILNGTRPDQAQVLARELQEKYHDNYPRRTINIGVGDEVSSVTMISDSFKRARAAMRMAVYLKKPIVNFSSMGIYKIFFTIEDYEVLRELHDEILAPILEYDRGHNAALADTLRSYIKNGGSIQAVSAETFTHRNTVNYRIRKIKELLQSDLDTAEERYKYMTAFYISDIISGDEAGE